MITTTNHWTTRTTLAAMAIAIALGGAAVAQTPQADPDHAAHHPEDTTTAQATPPAARPPSAPGAPGATPGAGPMGGPGMMMGGRGMMGPGAGPMGGPGTMGVPEEGERRRMMMHRGDGGAPMNVIINVGPDIRVDVEKGDERGGGRRGMRMGAPGGAGMMGPGMMGMMGPRGDAMSPDALRHFERIDAHLAYVRAALRVTDAQTPQWNAFAEAARASADRLRQAYAQAMQAAVAQPAAAPAQLERRMALLSAQLEATCAVATATEPLYAALSDEQKRTADELLAEHLRNMQMRGL